MLRKIIRALGLIIGLLSIAVFILMISRGDYYGAVTWTLPIMGVLFITYGVGGDKALTRVLSLVLPSYKKKIKNE